MRRYATLSCCWILLVIAVTLLTSWVRSAVAGDSAVVTTTSVPSLDHPVVTLGGWTGILWMLARYCFGKLDLRFRGIENSLNGMSEQMQQLTNELSRIHGGNSLVVPPNQNSGTGNFQTRARATKPLPIASGNDPLSLLDSDLLPAS